MAKKVENTEQTIGAVEEALSKTELFIESNQKTLGIIIGVVIVIVFGFMGFDKYIQKPKEKEAQSQLFIAEKYFEMDSINLALNGDNNYPGFLEIIDEFGSTKSGNLASYYVGVCYLRQGEFEDAIDYLKDFSSNDQIISAMATGAIGDAYVELGELKKGAGYYKDAASGNKNEFTTPLFFKKAGLIYEELDNYNEALSLYKMIQKDYSKSFEGREIEKHIAKAEAILAKS